MYFPDLLLVDSQVFFSSVKHLYFLGLCEVAQSSILGGYSVRD